jgi:hypothetical protein
MPTDNPTAKPPLLERPPTPDAETPLAIQIRGLEKTFRIPTHRIDSFKERVVRPRDYRSCGRSRLGMSAR